MIMCEILIMCNNNINNNNDINEIIMKIIII